MDESIYICTICNSKTFQSFEELSEHMNTDHEPQPPAVNITLTSQPVRNISLDKSCLPQLSFKLCGNNFIKVHPNKAVIVTQKNPQSVNTPFNLNDGSSTVDAKLMPLFVDISEKIFKQRNNSKLQINSLKFKCCECHKELSSAHNLERHKLVHTQEKNFVCEFCGLSFKREDNLKDHRCVVNEDGDIARIKRTRNQEEIVDGQVALVCPKCGKSFANVSNLNKHSKIHEEKKEVCAECGRRFHLKTSLKDHIVQIHEGGKMLTCSVCKKELKGRNSLFTHLVRFHPEQKNRVGPPKHACPDCGRVFHQSGNLRKHQLTHMETLSYVCSVCKTAFKFPEQLRRHKLKHDVSNQLPCEMCDKMFTMDHELKNHIEVYHGGMSYICKYCSLSCKHLQGFRRHLQRRHAEEMEWKLGGLAFLKASRIANDHYINIKVRKEPTEDQEQPSLDTAENLIQSQIHGDSSFRSHILPESTTLAYLTTDHLTNLGDLDDNLIPLSANGHRLPYYDVATQNDGKIRLHDIIEDEMSIKDSNQSTFGSSDPVGFDQNLIGHAPSGVFKDDQDNLITSTLANLAEYISFPVSETNAPDLPYMVGLDDCS